MNHKKLPSEHQHLMAESSQRPHNHRILRFNRTIQTPPASLIKPQVPNQPVGLDGWRIFPEFQSISGNLQAFAKMVEAEICGSDAFSASNVHSNSLFKRGRLYDEYSARRNEKLKRKKVEAEEEMINDALDPSALAAGFGKRNAKKTEMARKSIPPNFVVSHKEDLRSSARIKKENKKPDVLGNINKRIATQSKEEESPGAAHDPVALAVEFGKRNKKKTDAVRKSIPPDFTVGRREGLRSSARINKENKKPGVSGNIRQKSSVEGINKRIGTQCVKRN